ncbi:hypothetical protein PVK06_004257 [Gossypium arboreum]|uniref:Uncharacterized protein n=1 Tax=Gossypium arboreum TaxID=29729 RepID=A0ABR0QRI0_GOSAR|nr:hypothetical protein PVK06_004257 [Gossypium arboreum]
MENTTLVQHLVSGWGMHIGGSMFDAGNTYWGMTSTSCGWQSISDWGRCETSTRKDDVLPTTSTDEGTSLFHLNLKTLKGVQMKKKKICYSGRT